MSDGRGRHFIPILAAAMALGCLLAAPSAVAANRSHKKARAKKAKITAQLFNVPTGSAGLGDIVSGPDGALWFSETDAGKLGRITTGGRITEYSYPNELGTGPESLIASEGSLYMDNDSGRQILKVNPADPTHPATYRDAPGYVWTSLLAPATGGGIWATTWPDGDVLRLDAGGNPVHDFPADVDDSMADTFIGGPGGSVWFTRDYGSYITEITASGGTGSIAVPDETIGTITSLAFDRSGTLWFSRYLPGSWILDPSGGALGWVDSRNTAHVIDLHGDYAPDSLTAGPDGAMWFAEDHGIGRISIKGHRVTHYSIAPYQPDRITFGPDGALWMIDAGANRVGRVGITPRVRLRIPKQKLRTAIRKKALKAKCRLAVRGRCSVVAAIPAKRARKLKLKVGRKAKTFVLGTGSKKLKRAGKATVRIKLKGRSRRALRRVRGRLKVGFAATAQAADSIPSQATRTAKLHR